MVMRFEIPVHTQGGRMRSYLSQQSAFNKEPQIVIYGSERNRRNAAPHRRVNVFWRIVPMRRNDGLINYLPLVRDCQAVLRSQFTELLVSQTHNYRIRMIIKR